MRKKPNNTLIGIFILLGIGTFVAMIGVFVADRIFAAKENIVVMHFSESIKGLEVGSSVMFHGVRVGRVAKIDIIADLENYEFSIPVYVSFNGHNIISETREYGNKVELLNNLVKNGLRARLVTQNYLTGQLMIGLEMLPNDTPVYHQRDANVPEIPTVLSQFAELSRGIQDIPIRETFDKFNLFVDNVNDDLLPRLSKAAESVADVSKNSNTIPDAMQNFGRAMQRISEAARSFNNLTDYLERHPEALLRGKR